MKSGRISNSKHPCVLFLKSMQENFDFQLRERSVTAVPLISSREEIDGVFTVHQAFKVPRPGLPQLLSSPLDQSTSL